MEGHVQILGLPPTHSNPIIFLAIWSSMGETTRKQNNKTKVKERREEIKRKKGEKDKEEKKSRFLSPYHMEFFPPGPQI